jgi:hypothetical protein
VNRLQAEWRRLYHPERADAGVGAGADGLVAPGDRVRAMVLELARPADWGLLSAVWRGVQIDLSLPAPAIAVSGIDGYQLWFSLAQAVPVAQATAFLDALRMRYLADVPRHRVRLFPAEDVAAPGQARHAHPVPAEQPATGQWSAFIASDLAPLFADTPWLDFPPGPDAQADLLSRLAPIPRADFQRTLDTLQPAERQPTAPPATDSPAPGPAPTEGPTTDPRRFLLAVMNDPAAPLALRIEAAKALLPYGEVQRGNSAQA